MLYFRRLSRTRILILLTLALIFVSSAAHASQLDTKRKELDRIRAKIEANRKLMRAADQKQAEVLREIDLNDQKVSQLQDEIFNLQIELKETADKRKAVEARLLEAKKSLKKAETDLTVAEKQLAFKRELYNKRVNGVYKFGMADMMEILVNSRNLGDLIKRSSLLGIVVKRDAELVGKMKTLQKDIGVKVDKLASEKKIVNKQYLYLIDEENHMKAVKTRILVKQELFEAEIKRQKFILAKLDRNKAEFKNAEISLEASSNMIASQIRILERGGKLPEEYRADISGRGFLQPVAGRKTSGFGYRVHPVLRYKRLHTGIDFGARTGTPVYAAQSGKVLMAGWKGGYGYTVVISHGGGITTLYAHNSKLLVRSGQYVKRGQIVSRVGSTGLSTGPHLHFEVRVNGVPKNPARWI